LAQQYELICSGITHLEEFTMTEVPINVMITHALLTHLSKHQNMTY